jgi:hypothetical protein
MAKEHRHCIDVVTRINATWAALDKVALRLLDGHVRHCLVGGTESEPNEQAEETHGRRRGDDPAQAETGPSQRELGSRHLSSIHVNGPGTPNEETRGDLR